MELKDFQQATADRITALFRSGQNRVLLADEVGLGKTIVAREVVRQVAAWRRKELYGRHFKVVYVCSNVHIASQNAGKLGIPDQMNVSESRLSMQHLKIYQSAGRDHGSAQLIPLTPATSFSMTAGCGNQEERALMFAHLRRLPDFAPYAERLKQFLAYDAEKSWQWHVDRYEERAAACDENGSGYLADIRDALERRLPPDLSTLLLRRMRSRNEERDPGDRFLINRLRKLFAEISVEKLEPDLVIMDEFQRFRDLIAAEDDSEEAMLSRQFLSSDQTKVLLLSATPYKPYATLEELSQSEDADNYREFTQVMDFLFPEAERNRRFHRIWEDYSHGLSQISVGQFTLLLAKKARAEDALYQAAARTERFNTGVIDDSGVKEIAVTPGDFLSYDAMQTLLDRRGRTHKLSPHCRRVPIDYVKSAPYLLSFMENYQLKKQLRSCFSSREEFQALAEGMTPYLLLRKSRIHQYQPLPAQNARLEYLRSLVFPREGHGPEMLLWIPASRPYYRTKGVFAENRGCSKLLVFSSWEMVPRMISVMLSYEAERLTIGKLSRSARRKRGRGYFATREERRYGIARLKNEFEEIVCFVSDTLAQQYCPAEHLGRELSAVRRSVTGAIQEKLRELARRHKISAGGQPSAQNLLLWLQALEGREGALPRTLPEDAAGILADMAIGSPAVCAYRTLLASGLDSRQSREDAQAIAKEVFVSLFNKAESSAVLDLLYGEKGDDAYYRAVFRYCVEGNLQAVLDEYAHVLDQSGLREAMTSGFSDTVSLQIDTVESFPDQEKDRPRMRTHFAVGYFNARVSDENVMRTDKIRSAFNSPFRPFVLSTTSIGQEGLDFHLYCRKVMHWNLPSNPVDLEQREGRVNRYKCLAVRQNVARRYGGEPDWESMFRRAAEEEKGEYPDLVPYWCLPESEEDQVKIERYAPMYPLSRDKQRYERIIKVLSLYRLTLGQPRQEELISILDQEIPEESARQLFMNLSPYYRQSDREPDL